MHTTTTSGIWETESCGIPLKFPCPKDSLAFDRAAGYLGAAHHCAIQYIGLHDTLADWQEDFAKAVSVKFQIPRQINESATAKAKADAGPNAKVSPIYETVKKYIARVRVTLSPDQVKELTTLAQTVANDTPVDPSPAARRGAVAVENIRRAESLLSTDPDIYEAQISKYSEYIGGFVLDRNGQNIPTPESFGRLIQVYLKRKDDEVRQELAMAD